MSFMERGYLKIVCALRIIKKKLIKLFPNLLLFVKDLQTSKACQNIYLEFINGNSNLMGIYEIRLRK
jgi:hypothetical protein